MEFTEFTKQPQMDGNFSWLFNLSFYITR